MFDESSDEALGERLLALQAEQCRLEAEWMAVAAEWDRRQAWAADGSLNGAGWLANRARMASGTARERLRTAAKLAVMPATAAAYAEGSIGSDQVRTLCHAVRPATAAAFARDEETLVAHARSLDHRRFAMVVRHWDCLADADGTDPEAERRRRRLHLSRTFEGSWFLDGRLDPEGGAEVDQALEAICEDLRRGERAGTEAERTPAQRRADALVALARTALVAPAAAPARPSVTVVIDLVRLLEGDPLAARLADGTPISAEAARRLACDAGVARVLTAPGSVPVDLGRLSRTPSEAQRRALGLRHDTCAFPGCERPFLACELHHVVHWLDGGTTDLDNLAPLCMAHHHRHHEGRFHLARGPGGELVFTSPAGRLVGTVTPLADAA